MKYLLLVSHGGLAEGVKSSLKMFTDGDLDHVIALGLKDKESVSDFSNRVRRELAGLDEHELIVLADIIGGSPLTSLMDLLSETKDLEDMVVLGGMNLTMALTAFVMKDILEADELRETVLKEAGDALKEFVISSDEDDDEI
ncbi:PTS fructose transporter subunit IIA [Streptococcaceae bacterium ESL0687]|nr:PTS fructose transporter subunit IIA [Streptococcaceae bacterium ESL0687]